MGVHNSGGHAQVKVVEFNASTPFEEQLRVMAGTGVFVSVHTSNLANAQFLQPGSAVVEIIQRNWIWDNLDRSFQACSCGQAPPLLLKGSLCAVARVAAAFLWCGKA
jgi:hypothetical protein